MKKVFLVFSLFCAGLTRCDDLANLTQVLKKIVDQAELFKPGTGANKIRIIVQSEDYGLFDGTQILSLVQKAHEQSGGAIIKGVPELIRFDPENSDVLKYLKLSEYKTIFVAGWKSQLLEGNLLNNPQFFESSSHGHVDRNSNFFNWYGGTFMLQDSVAVVLVLLDSSLSGNPKVIQQSLTSKLKQVAIRLAEYGYGPLPLGYAQSPNGELYFFAVQGIDLKKYPDGFAAWLKRPLPAKSVVTQAEKDQKERIEKEHKERAAAGEDFAKQLDEAKRLEKEAQKEFDKNLVKAFEFKYQKQPKIRIIAQASNDIDAKKAAQAVSSFLVSQNIGTPEIVVYDYANSLINPLDSEYKNIFVFGWDSHQSERSTMFLRSDGYFSHYSKLKPEDFSPVTSLVLFVPQNQEAIDSVIKKAHVQRFVFKAPFPYLGGKLVSVGQFVQEGGKTTTKVFDIPGVDSLVDWIKYGVK